MVLLPRHGATRQIFPQSMWMKANCDPRPHPRARTGSVEIRPLVEIGKLPEMSLAGVTPEESQGGVRR
jgi:hypothetical protein